MEIEGMIFLIGAFMGFVLGFLGGELKEKHKKMITEDYVSFETAKLLKEKGFWENCPFSLSKLDEKTGEEKTVRCPTLQMAMKWLREAYSIHIYISIAYIHFAKKLGWLYGIEKFGENGVESIHWDGQPTEYNTDDHIFNTYEEVCEAAIKYCLKNLI